MYRTSKLNITLNYFFISCVISITDIIGLLSRALHTMTRREEDDIQESSKAIFYNKLWDVQPFNPYSYWFLKTGKVQIQYTNI